MFPMAPPRGQRHPDAMIRVAIVDDHPAVRLGLTRAIRRVHAGESV
jgi:hypothetical protein